MWTTVPSPPFLEEVHVTLCRQAFGLTQNSYLSITAAELRRNLTGLSPCFSRSQAATANELYDIINAL